MKKHFTLIFLVLLSGSLFIGARGCGIWAETDKDSYTTGEEGLATLHNDSYQTVYLPGCADFSYAIKLDDGTWEDKGPYKVCVWEGYARPVSPHGGAQVTPFKITEPGTWRLHYVIGYECKDDMPMNENNCTKLTDIYTDVFNVVEN